MGDLFLPSREIFVAIKDVYTLRATKLTSRLVSASWAIAHLLVCTSSQNTTNLTTYYHVIPYAPLLSSSYFKVFGKLVEPVGVEPHSFLVGEVCNLRHNPGSILL